MTKRQTAISNLLLFICATLLLTGCAGSFMGPSMEQPTISISDLQLREVKALETIFMLELRIINPNDFPIDVQGVNCAVKIDGALFATGVSDMQQQVPPFGTVTVPVMVYASMFDVVGSVIQLLQEGNQRNTRQNPLQYELSGKIRLRATGRSATFPFQSEGKLALD